MRNDGAHHQGGDGQEPPRPMGDLEDMGCHPPRDHQIRLSPPPKSPARSSNSPTSSCPPTHSLPKLPMPNLQRALAASPGPQAQSLSTTTPLLKASLSSPPVVHGPFSVSHRGNGSVDLSSRKRPHSQALEVSTSMSKSTRSPDRQVPQSMPPNNPELYANLIMQLRSTKHQGQASNCPPSPSCSTGTSSYSSSSRLTAAMRKEKLRAVTCFQCPVCRKRFQRHIAMSAHFQNEHIGSASKPGSSSPSSTSPGAMDHAGEKICMICNGKAKDMAAIRYHMLQEHSIDLENPKSFLVEPEPEASPPASSSSSLISAPAVSIATISPVKSSTKFHDFNNNNSSMLRASLTDPAPRRDVVTMIEIGGGHPNNHPFGGQPGSLSNLVTPASPSSPAPPRSLQGFGISPLAIQERLEQLQADMVARDHHGIKREEVDSLDLSMNARPRAPADVPAFHDRTGAVSVRRLPISSESSSSTSMTITSHTVTPRAKKSRVSATTHDKAYPTPGGDMTSSPWKCHDCDITFPNQTLYFLHRGFHSEQDPWRCNGCGVRCADMYDFNTHLVSDPHN